MELKAQRYLFFDKPKDVVEVWREQQVPPQYKDVVVFLLERLGLLQNERALRESHFVVLK